MKMSVPFIYLFIVFFGVIFIIMLPFIHSLVNHKHFGGTHNGIGFIDRLIITFSFYPQINACSTVYPSLL